MNGKKAYINPKILLSYERKRDLWRLDSKTIHFNPNYLGRGQKVFVNPQLVTMVNKQPTLQNVNKPSIAPSVNSKYSWRRMATEFVHPTKHYARSSNVNVSFSEKILVRKKMYNVINFHASNQKYAVNQSQFKLNRKISDEKKNTALKKNVTVNRKWHKLQHLFPRNIYKINRQKSQLQRMNRKADFKMTFNKLTVTEKLIKIGGILYRATSNKLTRTTKVLDTTKSPKSKPIISNGSKIINKHVINIRGEAFLLSRNGTTLKRLQSGSTTGARPRQRIDFGGVTFRQTSENVLVRTRSHQARQKLITAKQRSIACLTPRRRKVNVTCTVYRKTGRCRRHERGVCVFTHDRKNVDLCKRFLRGDCRDEKCLLSHDAVHQKVATCRFFLEGTCGRDNCPYLHVKVSGKASICPNFLQGYCELGQQCSLRHVNICPEFEKTGACKKGTMCLHPHEKSMRKAHVDRGKSKFNKVKNKDSNNLTSEIKARRKRENEETGERKEEGSARYYSAESQTCGEVEIVPKRYKLTQLPSYIAFESS